MKTVGILVEVEIEYVHDNNVLVWNHLFLNKYERSWWHKEATLSIACAILHYYNPIFPFGIFKFFFPYVQIGWKSFAKNVPLFNQANINMFSK